MRETASIGVILQGPHLQGAPFSWASQVALVVKCPPAKIGDIRDTGTRSLGQKDPLEEGNGSPLQYSCLENSMDKAA